MVYKTSRRTLLGAAPVFGIAAILGTSSRGATSFNKLVRPTGDDQIDSGFPRQNISAVEAIVSFSHFNFGNVKELVEARPALAKASWDWGFGDWETAIGAASHKGERQIAEFLIKHGARPTLFTFSMLGHVDVVRSMVKAQPGIQKTHGPHGFTLMYHAKTGGKQAESVVEYLEEIGDADLGEADAEIPAEEQETIMGTYSFGKADDEQIHILFERGELRIKRTGRVGRRLARVEKLVYHPTGAPSVRIRFSVSGDKADRLLIEDAKSSIEAQRE